ncbi:hypothetical protein B4144_3344 [Bacillus atrophaeus]|nr:hypothetical protein B4144_3344 [Bacillus atrophaeus]
MKQIGLFSYIFLLFPISSKDPTIAVFLKRKLSEKLRPLHQFQ